MVVVVVLEGGEGDAVKMDKLQIGSKLVKRAVLLFSVDKLMTSAPNACFILFCFSHMWRFAERLKM